MTTNDTMGGERKVDVLARFNAEVAAADKRIAETNGGLQAMYIEQKARSQSAYDAVSELMAAAVDFLHVESCAYNAMSIVAPRDRLKAALARIGSTP
jgi:hypothetical protein